MNNITAATGWMWVKEGFAIFRMQPAQFMMLFIGYLLAMLIIGILPIVGQLVPLWLAPTFSMIFMIASYQVERDGRMQTAELREHLASSPFRKLLLLGLLYLLAGGLAIAASSFVDGGFFLKTMLGQAEATPEAIRQSNMMVSMIAAGLFYLPAAMAFWFAAPLIVWQGMPVFKAIFYSFFAVFHAGRAFLIYAACWIVIGILLPSLLTIVLALLIGRGPAVMIFMFILSILLTVVMYCSFYPTYRDVFGDPHGHDESGPADQAA